MGWNGLERDKLDFILTDLLPVEISELFSFRKFYSFLLIKSNKKKLDNAIREIKQNKSKNDNIMFKAGWATQPLKYKIIKGTDAMREMSIIQPFSALNLYLFISVYQKYILNYFEKHHKFSIRYHKKNTDLYYKSKKGEISHYFHKESFSVGRDSIQQAGNYFKIIPFESINSFADSRIWRMCNFKYKYYAKMDYKSCFDSIYTHAFTWMIERNTTDAKNANNYHLFITIDRILQNINGRVSNGIVVGPEFSRMIAEILLQHIDEKIEILLAKEKILYNVDYVVFRYVDDIFLFANHPGIIEKVIKKYKTISEKYLLRLNELKLVKGNTPCLPKEWLEKTRQLSDVIGDFFFKWKKSDYDKLPDNEKFIVKPGSFFIDKIKDEIVVLSKTYKEEIQTIVSFLLSTLLNNISKKKNGYTLFGEKNRNKAFLLLDLAFYIYAYYPSFTQTRKMISMISYIDSEINFKNSDDAKTKLSKIINRYDFIFRTGNIFDLCDWFPLFLEYHINLDMKTESTLIEEAEKYNNPIIWANLLLYSKYYTPFFKELKNKIEMIVDKQINRIYDKDPMMQNEFWYLLIFHNCPYISHTLQTKMFKLISDIELDCSKKQEPSFVCKKLLCEFLNNNKNGKKPEESFFNWKGIENFSAKITYRTYQRTIFKTYKKSKNKLYASIE